MARAPKLRLGGAPAPLGAAAGAAALAAAAAAPAGADHSSAAPRPAAVMGDNDTQVIAAYRHPQIGLIHLPNSQATATVVGARCDVLITAGHVAYRESGDNCGEVRAWDNVWWERDPTSQRRYNLTTERVEAIYSRFGDSIEAHNRQCDPVGQWSLNRFERIKRHDLAVIALTDPVFDMRSCNRYRLLHQVGPREIQARILDQIRRGKIALRYVGYPDFAGPDGPPRKRITGCRGHRPSDPLHPFIGDERVIPHSCDTLAGSSGAPLLVNYGGRPLLVGVTGSEWVQCGDADARANARPADPGCRMNYAVALLPTDEASPWRRWQRFWRKWSR